MSPVMNSFKMVIGLKYNGKYLCSIIQKYVGQLKLHDTLANVVIPTFDIRMLQPTIFTNFAVQFPFLILQAFIAFCVSCLFSTSGY
jgi:patatin-like phospholipase/acyl hydrolase